ncbi:MAG: hypothetical protein A2W08_11785 [Candidatus Rokubacteria bacterium RBG_16_73_20]|nr:MAG: hypothetical protein A2W08_11785 [Candidatus Rokubacteria bacterium RBG_16_73_20]HBH03591.1 hypothetical protein [Candidatus Rokubacteria bacterium]
MTFFCPYCERPTAKRTELGYIANDGTTGHVAGIACAACGYIAQDPGAEYVPDGHRLDVPSGMTAMQWFIERLRAMGCDPRPHP